MICVTCTRRLLSDIKEYITWRFKLGREISPFEKHGLIQHGPGK